MEQGPPIRGARMASAEWKAACERALTDAPSTSEPMLGTVRAHLGARIVLHVTAFYRDLLHVCEVSLAGPLTTSTLARFRVAEGGTELVGADPEIEFANTDGVNPWALVRRVLPPFEEYTADGPDSSTEAAPLTIDDETGRACASCWRRTISTPPACARRCRGSGGTFRSPTRRRA